MSRVALLSSLAIILLCCGCGSPPVNYAEKNRERNIYRWNQLCQVLKTRTTLMAADCPDDEERYVFEILSDELLQDTQGSGKYYGQIKLRCLTIDRRGKQEENLGILIVEPDNKALDFWKFTSFQWTKGKLAGNYTEAVKVKRPFSCAIDVITSIPIEN